MFSLAPFVVKYSQFSPFHKIFPNIHRWVIFVNYYFQNIFIFINFEFISFGSRINSLKPASCRDFTLFGNVNIPHYYFSQKINSFIFLVNVNKNKENIESRM
ncbi:hypothetical protein ABD75_06495 [Bacillus vallismortis]|nr:hypothetical protein [Bacillus vallismortis]QAV09276.1 hypothetical protein BV11031_11985 [Bacillus vallismortis]